MTCATIELPDNIDACHRMIENFHQLLHAKDVAVTDLSTTVDELKRQVEYLMRQTYGRKSEQLDPNDTLFAQWFNNNNDQPTPDEKLPGEPATQTIAAHERTKPTGRKPLPANLPRKQVVYALRDEDLPCPCCGEVRHEIGREVSEQLEYVPASLYVLRHERLKYACKTCEGEVAIADKPVEGLSKSLAGPGLHAQILTSKYGDHIPLYRLERIFKRHGVDIPRSTMCQWVGQSADLCSPLIELMKRRILDSKVIQTDDTPVKQQTSGKGKLKTCRFWPYRGDETNPYTVFDYTPDRSRDGPLKWFKNTAPGSFKNPRKLSEFRGFRGFLQTDAYSVYDVFFDKPWQMTHVGCWAHVRRKFYECRTASPQAHEVLLLIGALYKIEKQAKELDAQRRFELRQSQSASVLEKIFAWCESKQVNTLPKTGLGQAIRYALNQREALSRYITDADLSIDNNACEREIRSIAIGRKNWLFTGSERGGKSAAIIFSLIASCDRHDVDPYAYLRDVITRLPATPLSQINQFLPDVWKTRQKTKMPGV